MRRLDGPVEGLVIAEGPRLKLSGEDVLSEPKAVLPRSVLSPGLVRLRHRGARPRLRGLVESRDLARPSRGLQLVLFKREGGAGVSSQSQFLIEDLLATVWPSDSPGTTESC